MRINAINICLASILVVYSGTTYSQDVAYSVNLDSLQKVLITQKDDTNKVNTLNLLSDYYNNRYNPDSSIRFAKLARDLSKKISFKKGEGIALLEISVYYTGMFNYDEALKNATQALLIFKETGLKWSVALTYKVLGGAYASEEKIPEALENLYKALKVFEELGDNQQAAYTLSFIGWNYYWQEDYANALTAYTNALKFFQKLPADPGNMCYVYIAKIYKIQGHYKEALSYDSIGLRMSIARDDKQMTATAYACMGDLQLEKIKSEKPLVKSSEYLKLINDIFKDYDEALNNFKNVPDSGGMGDTYEALSKMYIFQHQLLKAQRYADSALICAEKIQSKENSEHSYLLQATIDSITGNYEHAFESYKKYIVFRDSLINDKNTKKSLQTQMQYDFDKKESIAKAAQDKKDADAKRVKNQQYFTIAALGVVVLAILIIALIQFRNNKQKQKANLFITEQKEKVESTLSELKSTQAQLIQSEKMASLGELTAGIAHEIQNPLNFVNNFSEINKELVDELTNELNTGNKDEAISIAKDIKENEEKINHHGKRADAIVKNMLQHSRASTGQKELTDINALADEYLRLSYHGMRAKDKTFNATMKPDFDKNIGKINIIPQDIGRVLLNLFNNAFYSVNEKTKQQTSGYEPGVSVSTKKINNTVQLTVKDNGNGIPQKVVDKIFQPFFTTKPTGEGTGLGLSLSYDIIKTHGGEIKVETNEGEGSEFIIHLPIHS